MNENWTKEEDEIIIKYYNKPGYSTPHLQQIILDKTGHQRDPAIIHYHSHSLKLKQYGPEKPKPKYGSKMSRNILKNIIDNQIKAGFLEPEVAGK